MTLKRGYTPVLRIIQKWRKTPYWRRARRPAAERGSVLWKLCRIRHSFHAKGHLFEVVKAIYGSASEIGERWARMRREELDEGRVDEVIAALRSHAGTCEEARKNAEYFSNNRERMNYPTFRAMGLCVATGVVEGGCKHIVGARLKHGGMRWTVAGANAIIALRCAVESNRFDDFWERRVSTRS